MLWIYRFIKGYLKITVKGECSEKILNLCAKNRITLWNSKIIKNGIETCICIKDFFELPEIVKGSNLRIHIIEKNGLPIRLSKNKRRLGLFIGATLMFTALQLASGYIWIIDVEGNKAVNKEDILKACRNIGITEGIKADSISPKIKREQLLLELDSLAWASLNVEGCRLTVNASEIKALGKEDDTPTNLKAKADGIIKKINVTSGNCLVKTGDTVKKGDVLVSGVIEASDGTRFVKSAGIITAYTTRELTSEGNFTEIIEYETGQVKQKTVLDFFTLKIPFYLGSEIKEYNSVINTKQAELFGKSIPVKMHTREFKFIEKRKVAYNKQQLAEKLKKDTEIKLSDMDINEYTVVSQEFSESENGLKITSIIKAEEDIVMPEALYFAEKD